MLSRKTSLIGCAALLAAVGCGDDTEGSGGAGGDGTTGATTSATTSATTGATTTGSTTTAATTTGGLQTKSLSVELTGLEPLGGGYEYEGWIMVNDAPVTTGRFQIEAGVTMYSFEVATADVDAATAFVLSIEPPNDADPAPSEVKVLGGDFNGTGAALSTGHMAALGVDLTTVTGSYLLATPTTAAIAGDYNQGIWFLDPAAGPGASLDLPALPAGFVYEGWVVGANGPVSTGTFSSPAGADSDGAGAYAGPDAGPPFPGQDFIDPAMVLSGGMAVISVEPVPDDSPAPFAIKPLVDMVEDVAPPAVQALAANALPAGNVTRP